MADDKDYATATPHSLALEIGERLAKIRLARNITQQALAKEAGIGVRTLRRLEAGQPSTLDSVLRIAVALGIAGAIPRALPSQDIRPIERLSARRAERKRARPAARAESGAPWSWGDEPDD